MTAIDRPDALRRRPASVPEWILSDDLGAESSGPRVCAFCGEQAPADSAFCPNDGRALTAALIPASGEPLTVLFTDIEDSVQLTERLGDRAWAEIVDDHNSIVREAIGRYAGFEVKNTGDGFLVLFADAAQAVACAVNIQQRIAARAAGRPDWPVRVRMGLHRGEVILRPGWDVLGRTVNMAERILAKSAGGEIWLSAHVFEAAAAALGPSRWLDRGMRRLRGVGERQRLYELMAPAAAEGGDSVPEGTASAGEIPGQAEAHS